MITKLKDICEFIVDCPHTTAQDEGAGYPLIRTPNIGKGRFNLDGVHRVSQDVYKTRNLRATPQDNDLIFAREAPAGNVAIIKNGDKFCLGQRTVLIRPNPEHVNPVFLTYYLLAPKQQYGLLGTANGATVAHVNLPTIRELEVEIPSLEQQKRIGGILSAYDDLIENNQKQIKLLEEAAQRLYKEWFVDFHFPGYENVKIVDGVPEGWQIIPIEAVYEIKYGKNLSTSFISEHGKYPVYGANGIIGYYDSANCNHCVTLITSRGNGSGDVSRTHIPNAFITNNSFIVLPKAEYKFCKVQYIFYSMKNINFKAICTGSAQPQLTNASIRTLEIIQPNKELISRFCNVTESIFHEIDNLLYQINGLKEARDRLLPKLMSGELEV